MSRNFTTSIGSHLPSQSLGYSNASTGSDALNVINNFLSNTETPICGSTVFMMIGRNPFESEISEIVIRLQQNYVFVRTLFMDSLLGGSDSLVLYNVSSETNGLGVFSNLDYIDEAVDFVTNSILNQYLLYAYSPTVSGQGQIELPFLHTPDYFSQTLSVFIDITVQNHPLTDNFLFLNLTLTDTIGKHQSVIIDGTLLQDFNGYFSADVFLKSDQDFDVSLAYKYGSATQEALEIRMSINQALPSFPPYNN